MTGPLVVTVAAVRAFDEQMGMPGLGAEYVKAGLWVCPDIPKEDMQYGKQPDGIVAKV